MILILSTSEHVISKTFEYFLIAFLCGALFLMNSCAVKSGEQKVYLLHLGSKKKGIYHTVSSGQSLWRIAKVYDVSPDKIASYNGFDDKTDIQVGQKIFIPGAETKKYVPPYPLPLDSKQPADAAPPVNMLASATREDVPVRASKSAGKSDRSLPLPESVGAAPKMDFIWPLKGLITSTFGAEGGTHFGIDIAVPRGTPIKAVAAGVVSYVDYSPLNYGNFIIVQHARDYASVYAHNSENLVEVGQKVTQGMVIAYVGSTGKATGDHLHFELRYKRKARNPLWFLPH